MTVINLNQTDKENLRADIKLTLIFGFFFFLIAVLIVAVIPLTMYLFGKNPSDGFVTRGLLILGILFLPFVYISWTNVLKYIDLKKGFKSRIETTDYDLQKERNSIVIRTKEPYKMKFEIFTDIDTRIDKNSPITIEYGPVSKTVLFISNDQTNRLYKIEGQTDPK